MVSAYSVNGEADASRRLFNNAQMVTATLLRTNRMRVRLHSERSLRREQIARPRLPCGLRCCTCGHVTAGL